MMSNAEARMTVPTCYSWIDPSESSNKNLTVSEHAMDDTLTQLPSGNYVNLASVISVYSTRRKIDDEHHLIIMATENYAIVADTARDVPEAATKVRVLAEMVNRAKRTNSDGDNYSEFFNPNPLRWSFVSGPKHSGGGAGGTAGTTSDISGAGTGASPGIVLCTPENKTQACMCGDIAASKRGRAGDRSCMHPEAIRARVVADAHNSDINSEVVGACEPLRRTRTDCQCSVDQAIAHGQAGDKVCNHFAAAFVRAAISTEELGVGGVVTDDIIRHAMEIAIRQSTQEKETTADDSKSKTIASTGGTYQAALDRNKQLEAELQAVHARCRALRRSLLVACIFDESRGGIRVRDEWCQGLDISRLKQISAELKTIDAEAWAVGHLLEQLLSRQ